MRYTSHICCANRALTLTSSFLLPTPVVSKSLHIFYYGAPFSKKTVSSSGGPSHLPLPGVHISPQFPWKMRQFHSPPRCCATTTSLFCPPPHDYCRFVRMFPSMQSLLASPWLCLPSCHVYRVYMVFIFYMCSFTYPAGRRDNMKGVSG